MLLFFKMIRVLYLFFFYQFPILKLLLSGVWWWGEGGAGGCLVQGCTAYMFIKPNTKPGGDQPALRGDNIEQANRKSRGARLNVQGCQENKNSGATEVQVLTQRKDS